MWRWMERTSVARAECGAALAMIMMKVQSILDESRRLTDFAEAGELELPCAHLLNLNLPKALESEDVP